MEKRLNSFYLRNRSNLLDAEMEDVRGLILFCERAFPDKNARYDFMLGLHYREQEKNLAKGEYIKSLKSSN